MRISGHNELQLPHQIDLTRSLLVQIGAANYVADAASRVVDHRREHVGKNMIAPSQDEVAHLREDILHQLALNGIREGDARLTGAQPCGGVWMRRQVARAAGSRVARLILQLAAAASAGKDESATNQKIQGVAIRLGALRLVQDRTVPFEAERLQRAQNTV